MVTLLTSQFISKRRTVRKLREFFCCLGRSCDEKCKKAVRKDGFSFCKIVLWEAKGKLKFNTQYKEKESIGSIPAVASAVWVGAERPQKLSRKTKEKGRRK